MEDPQHDNGTSDLELRQFYRGQIARATTFFQQGEYDAAAATLDEFAQYENVPLLDQGLANLYLARLPEKINDFKLRHIRRALACFSTGGNSSSKEEQEVDTKTRVNLIKMVSCELLALEVEQEQEQEAEAHRTELATAKETRETKLRYEITCSTQLIMARVFASSSLRAPEVDEQKHSQGEC